MTVREFLKATGAKAWYECHFSIASTLDAAMRWFAARGLVGDIYQVGANWWLVPDRPVTKDISFNERIQYDNKRK